MKSEFWKGRIRFCLLGEYYFHQDLFELTFPHVGKIIILPADTRVKNLKDPKFGAKGLGATGSHLFAIIEKPDTIQEIYKKCILLQHCLLTIPTYKEIAVDPGYQQLLIDYKTNLSDDEIQEKFTSTSISYGIEIYKEGSFITYGGGIYSKQQINQKTFKWNGEIEAINSNHPF